MPGFEHQAQSEESAPEQTSARGTRYGRWLFVAYATFYAAFVYLNAFRPDVMQQTPLSGINVAVLYGLALILVAFLLALFYDWMCRFLVPRPKTEGEVRK